MIGHCGTVKLLVAPPKCPGIEVVGWRWTQVYWIINSYRLEQRCAWRRGASCPVKHWSPQVRDPRGSRLAGDDQPACVDTRGAHGPVYG